MDRDYLDESDFLPDELREDETPTEVGIEDLDQGTDPLRVVDAAYARTGSSDALAITRTLPHSRDAEVALLGAIMRNNALLGEAVAARLTSKDFFRDAHRRIFTAMRSLRDRGVPIDFATLATELARNGELGEVGGRQYLRALVDSPPADAVAAHARIIRDEAHMRDLIHELNKGLARCYDDAEPARELYGDILARIWNLGARFMD